MQIDWQTSSKEDLARNVFATANHIRIQQAQQRRLMLHYMQLYANGNINGLGQRGMPEDVRPFLANNTAAYIQGSHFNLCAMMCDTACSMVAQSAPLPIYITSGDNLKVARKAEKRTKVLQSQMNALSKGVATEAFDYCVQTGTGVVHSYLDDDGLPALEAVNPLEILVEHLDGQYRKPRSLHRVKYVSKSWLATMFPGDRDTIMASSLQDVDTVGGYLLPQNMTTLGALVEVIESWYLPTGKIKGRHSIVVSSGSLLDEQYTDKEFPFDFCRWKNRPTGFWGIGLIECVRPTQNRINQLIARVARGQDLASNVIVFSPNNGEGAVNPDFITNKVGLIIPYDPLIGPPTLGKWDGTMVDLQQQIDLEVQRALQENGISEGNTQGEPEPGMTSGVAVRAADSVSSRRLFHPTARFEEMCLGMTKMVERLNDQVAENNNSYAPTGYISKAGVNFLMSSNWKELAFEEGQACLNLMKMSAIPTTPEGKWAAVQEWIQAGFMNRETGMKLLEFPALDEFAGLETAMMDLVIKQICDILDGKPGVLPLPRQSAKVTLEVGTKAWAKLVTMVDMDDEEDMAVVDTFEDWLVAAEAMRDAAVAAAQPPMPEAPAAPMGGIAPTQVATPAVAA